MLQGLIIPDVASGEIQLALSPLGEEVRRLTSEMSIPSSAIDDYRKSERERIEAAINRKITALLAHNPDTPEDDEALDRWARFGGPAPLSEARKKEISEKLANRVRSELKDRSDGDS